MIARPAANMASEISPDHQYENDDLGAWTCPAGMVEFARPGVGQ
jgi:hypothetical protein